MEQAKIDRINVLAQKAKRVGLSKTEKAEQQALRQAYIAEYRAQIKAQLDHTVVLNPDGTSYRPRPGKRS